MQAHIFTIGHSNHSWETFAPLLIDNEIELVVDVRTNPVSRFAPFSNRRRFPDLLESIDIGYEFMGGPLGGKPADPAMYDSSGKPDYCKIRSAEGYKEAIDRLLEFASQSRTAILCSEGEPKQCHRRLLLEPSLVESGCKLVHIMRDGTILEEPETCDAGHA